MSSSMMLRMNELINNEDTEIAAVNMRITIGVLNRTVVGRENISGFQKQFEVQVNSSWGSTSCLFEIGIGK